MAMDFPNSPAVNDTFTVGDKTWKWTGSVWEIVASRPPMRTASDTPPASPIPSDEWFNSLTGRTYIWYDNYWVEQNTNSVVGASGLNGVASASAPLVYNSTNNNISVSSNPAFTGRIRMTGTSSDTSGVLELQSFDNALNYIYKANGGGLNFTTQAGVSMTIDQGGRVTKPFQPRFSSWRSAGSIAAGNVVLYDQVAINVGSCYNSATGRFTAPIAGTYKFHVEAIFGTALGTYRLYYRINGSVYQGDYHLRVHNYNGGEYTKGARDLVINLSANDYVEMYYGVGPSDMYGLTQYATFSGYLLG